MLDSFTRRNFLRATALAATAVSTGVLALRSVQRKKIRIRPIAGRHYSPRFLAFCASARFDSASHALRSVCSGEEEFALEVIPETAA